MENITAIVVVFLWLLSGIVAVGNKMSDKTPMWITLAGFAPGLSMFLFALISENLLISRYDCYALGVLLWCFGVFVGPYSSKPPSNRKR